MRPTAKPIADQVPMKNNRPKITIPTTPTVLYSRARKASAPSCTAAEIACIRELPASCLITQLAVTSA